MAIICRCLDLRARLRPVASTPLYRGCCSSERASVSTKISSLFFCPLKSAMLPSGGWRADGTKRTAHLYKGWVGRRADKWCYLTAVLWALGIIHLWSGDSAMACLDAVIGRRADLGSEPSQARQALCTLDFGCRADVTLACLVEHAILCDWSGVGFASVCSEEPPCLVSTLSYSALFNQLVFFSLSLRLPPHGATAASLAPGVVQLGLPLKALAMLAAHDARIAWHAFICRRSSFVERPALAVMLEMAADGRGSR